MMYHKEKEQSSLELGVEERTADGAGRWEEQNRLARECNLWLSLKHLEALRFR